MESVAVARWFAARSHLAHVRTRHRAPHTNGVVERWIETLEYEHLYRHDIAGGIDLADQSPTSPTNTTRSGPTRPSTRHRPWPPTYKPEHSNRTRLKLSRKPDPGHATQRPCSPPTRPGTTTTARNSTALSYATRSGWPTASSVHSTHCASSGAPNPQSTATRTRGHQTTHELPTRLIRPGRTRSAQSSAGNRDVCEEVSGRCNTPHSTSSSRNCATKPRESASDGLSNERCGLARYQTVPSGRATLRIPRPATIPGPRRN